jgi:chromosome segregation ATPase
MDVIERKLEGMFRELERMQNENSHYKSAEERLKSELNNTKIKLEKKRGKLSEVMEYNDTLKKRISDLETNSSKNSKEFQGQKPYEDMKKVKLENKKKAIEDMQQKISTLKSICNKQRSKQESVEDE